MDKLEQIQETLAEIDARVPAALRAAMHIGYTSSPVPAPLAIFSATVLPPPAAKDGDDEAVVPGELDGVSLVDDEEEEPGEAAPALGIRYGSCYVPLHDHDAHFGHAEAGAFGVADGVGGYMRLRVDAGAFSRGLMANALAEASAAAPGAPACPRALLEAAHKRTAASGATGASTAVILSLGGGVLRWAYIGDSSFAVLRGGRVVCRSKPQQHFFNAPFRLSADPEYCDDLAAARAGRMQAREGDVVVVGTDGLFDNVRDEQLERVVRMGTRLGFSPKNMADVIAGVAFELSKRTLVGKPDDITVVVAFVVQSSDLCFSATYV